MTITKASEGGQAVAVSREDLDAIQALARKELTEEEVYLFSVRLCDNEVDRDHECFPAATLEELASLFVGKCGIFDHQWSARGQAARIYKTEVVQEPGKLTRTGESYCWLKGYAYMMRTQSNQDLIAEIEGGIKKEVSVGCQVERAVCSICGTDIHQQECCHKKGEYYDDRLCYVTLEGASDAYEFSFVAVPAQPAAGVVKSVGVRCSDLKELVKSYPQCEAQLWKLEQEAALGRKHLNQLREDVVRLGALSGLGLKAASLKAMTDKLTAEELEELKAAYEKQAAKRYPLNTQLDYTNQREQKQERDGAFLI